MNSSFSGNSRMPFMQQQQLDNSLNFSFAQSQAQPPFYTSVGYPRVSFPTPGTTAPSLMSTYPNPNLMSSNAMNEYVDQHLQQQQMQQNAINLQQNNNIEQATLPDQNKSLGALTVADLTRILQPIQTSIQEIKTTINHQMGALQNKVQVLENELKKEVSKNEQLTSIMVTMQKSLNMIDSDKRVTNLMINGLPEDDLADTHDTPLVEDQDQRRYQGYTR